MILWSALAIPVASGITFPLFVTWCVPSNRAHALSDLKSVGVSCALYRADFDDRFPIAANWADATKSYRKDDEILRMPETKEGTSVAFMTVIQSKAYEALPNHNRQVAFFETTDTRANAHGPFENVWWHKDRKTAVGFLDTSAKSYRYYDENAPAAGTGLLPGPKDD